MDVKSEPVLPLPELRESPSDSGAGPFNAELIASLPYMTLEHLSLLEDELSKEFALLAKEFTAARSARVEDILAVIDTQIKKCKARDAAWSRTYTQKVHTIEKLANYTEDTLLADKRRGLKNVEQELAQLAATSELPTDIDDIFGKRQQDLPFADYFADIIAPFQQHLVALSNQKHLQTDLIEHNVDRYRLLVWKQYKRDAMEYRQHLIDETYHQLLQLHSEYNGVREETLAAMGNAHYYRSVVSPESLQRDEGYDQQQRLEAGNIDSYFDIDNPYARRNKIEITDTKMDALNRLLTFAAQQCQYTIPQIDDAVVKLSACRGLTEEEADADLALLRQLKRPHSPEPAERRTPEGAHDSDSSQDQYHEVLSISRQPSNIAMVPVHLQNA